ncbi:related to BOI1-BEM1 protein-binding protein [Sporisorium reilianum f. sp. reilianum]|uniref:Related to BOI1-BEM1 protein-binding protein n=1 Tax=Sporisorium reilianum f. sp. reilianum TaxID=72559 RepID=A0A2N8UE77_9BASI|nr:related to BOI1-BEM1 protein-binding protein [Sporisorium reilianum f. sp. reilianum]
MASPKSVDRVWALHDFEAENPDEVSFKAGECILVVEKDDEYGDGWWQGTNESGHTGLFPFTYTTIDRNLALSAKSGNATPDALGTPQPASSSAKPGVMHSTMADIDNALTELQSDRKPSSVNANGAGAGAAAAAIGLNSAADSSRASFTSERTDADDQSDNFGESDDYATRSVAARAALAANAQKNLANDAERQKQEEQRMRADAQREFEEEEARQRVLLLEKEKERQAKLAAGEIDHAREKSKAAAPIAGVDMSDESDSEGSVVGQLDDFQDKTHSPLFGNLASTPTDGVAAREIQPPTSTLQGIVEDEALSQPRSQPNETPAESSAPASAPLTSNDFVSAVAPHAEAAETAALPAESHSHAAPALAAGVGAVALGGVAAAATAAGVAGHDRSANGSFVNHSVAPAADESVRSIAGDSIRTGAGTGVGTGTATAATSIAAPTTEDLPPTTSTAAAPANLPSDPTEWNVDHVVEWARSKGWDEAAVVGKFREHEISGDVLLEMDINILKEIDILAFGKRFQVANGIKELRAQMPGAVTTPGLSQPAQADGLGSPAIIAPGAGSATGTPTYSPYTPGSLNGSNADGRSLNARMAETSLDQGFAAAAPSSSRPGSYRDERDRDSFGGPTPPGFGAAQGFGGAAGVAAWQAQQAGQGARSRQPSEGFMRGSGDAPLSPTSASQFGMSSPRYQPTGGANEDRLGALPTSPRKRESTGSAGTSEKNNRTSFFGLGQRNRKPPPGQAGGVGGPGSSGHDEEKSKGTLSRLGFARSSRNISSQSSQSNMKEQISLPTSSPHFDSNGDTARRQRQSTGAATAMGAAGVAGAAAGVGMGANARPTSIGSAGVDATPTPSAAGAAAGGNAAANGPVMARIQPVDLEGWIKKKGERYNSWKPRYLALKGPDLVILRDPCAEKIKGYVNMKGYKVIADENTNPGKYGFKILHETEKPHYFSSEDPILVREWMKALMKSTIGRDHSFPVISSYNNATISLKEAQRMNPPPRPPSPTSRARTQRAKARPNPEQLTARDAAILMNLTSGQPTRADDL